MVSGHIGQRGEHRGVGRAEAVQQDDGVAGAGLEVKVLIPFGEA
jgi:hypothetical protein